MQLLWAVSPRAEEKHQLSSTHILLCLVGPAVEEVLLASKVNCEWTAWIYVFRHKAIMSHCVELWIGQYINFLWALITYKLLIDCFHIWDESSSENQIINDIITNFDLNIIYLVFKGIVLPKKINGIICSRSCCSKPIRVVYLRNTRLRLRLLVKLYNEVY